ncbi:MAG: SsrA-binding protein SmpB [Acidimicrobiia bacterium]
MAKRSAGDGTKLIAQNRRARFDYELVDTYEAGIALTGSEVKSLRAGNADLKDSYVSIRNGQATWLGAYIAPYPFAREGGHEPERERRLLLHRQEIDRLDKALGEKGLTLVPLRLYFRNGRAKLEFATGRGKKTIDKRQDLKRRDQQREMERGYRR